MLFKFSYLFIAHQIKIPVAQAARQEAAQAAAAEKLDCDEIVELPQDKNDEGISGVDCSVCLNRPVQATPLSS